MSVARSVALAAWLAPAIAQADDIVTDEDACRGRSLGTACTFDGGSGTCQTTTCKSMDYATKPPSPVAKPCAKCLPGEPTKAEPTKAEPPNTPTDAAARPTAPDETTKGGCAIDPGPGAAASVLLGLVLVGVARRGPRR